MLGDAWMMERVSSRVMSLLDINFQVVLNIFTANFSVEFSKNKHLLEIIVLNLFKMRGFQVKGH